MPEQPKQSSPLKWIPGPVELLRRWRRRVAKHREVDALVHAAMFRADGRYRPGGEVHCTAARWLAIAEATGGDYCVIGKISEPDGAPIPVHGPKPALLETLHRRTAAGGHLRIDLGPLEMGILVDVAHRVGDEHLYEALRSAVARNAFPLHITLDEQPPHLLTPGAGTETR